MVPVASGELSFQKITHVDILGRMDRTLPTSGARHSDDLPMDTLPLKDDHVFVKVQDISTDIPEDTDVSTASDVVFPIGYSCELDQQVHETIIPGVGIVSSLSSVVILAFHTFLFSRLIPFLELY